MPRPHRALHLLLLAAALCVPAGPARAGGGPQNLLVVVNDASPESLAVANHYRHARNIPAACFCHLDVQVRHDIPKADFERDILAPVLQHIEKNGLQNHVRFIVFTMGLPYRIAWNASTKISVTTPAAAGSMSIGHMNDQPWYTAEGHFRGLPSLPTLSVCLTGYSVDDVRRCIDQGVRSDETFPKGTVYLFDGVGPRARVHEAYGRPQAVEGLAEAGIKAEVRPGHSLTNEQDVLGYWTGAVRVTTKGVGFLPGALADHLTSFGGILFDNKSQMSILDFIQAGATGSYGTVMEPTNIPTRHSKGWLFCRYASGLTMVESYWSCVQDVQIGVFVGEPLACPFAKKPAVAIEGLSPDAPASGELTCRISARPSAPLTWLRDLSWWVDGRPFGPALSHDALVGTTASLRVKDRAFEAPFDPAAGLDALARALAEAVEADPELAKPDGVRAAAQGASLVLSARTEGPAGNAIPFALAFAAPPGERKPVELRADRPEGTLAGGAETEEIPASIEITVNAKELTKGDTLTISSGGETYTAAADEKTIASENPLVAFLKKILEPMERSKVFGKPQARGIGQPMTRVIVTLSSAKSCEEGNGQAVEIRLDKEKASKLTVSPSGARTLDGGALRKHHASARLALYSVFEPPADLEVTLDTRTLGEGHHRLRLVAEEDTRIAAQGFAVAEIFVSNEKGKLRLSVPKRLDPAKPILFSAGFTGYCPGGLKRIAFLADGRDVGDFDPRSKKFLLDRAKVRVGAGFHRFQARVEPKDENALPWLSEPVELTLPD